MRKFVSNGECRVFQWGWILGVCCFLMASSSAFAAPAPKYGAAFQARLKLAKQGYQTARATFQMGRATVIDVARWSKRILRTHLDFLRAQKSRKTAARIQPLREHFRRMQWLFQATKAKVQQGMLPQLASLEVQYLLSEATFWLKARIFPL